MCWRVQHFTKQDLQIFRITFAYMNCHGGCILTPIVGLIWGLIAKMTLIKIIDDPNSSHFRTQHFTSIYFVYISRPSDGYSWFECCQHRDISELFLESYSRSWHCTVSLLGSVHKSERIVLHQIRFCLSSRRFMIYVSGGVMGSCFV